MAPYCKYLLREKPCAAGCAPGRIMCHKWFRGTCTRTASRCTHGLHGRTTRPDTTRGCYEHNTRRSRHDTAADTPVSREDAAYQAWVDIFHTGPCTINELRILQTRYHPDKVLGTRLVPLHTRISQFLNSQMDEQRARDTRERPVRTTPQ